MKTKKYILFAIISLLISHTGCNDEAFLEEVPETFYTIENSFNNTDQVNASVTNLYVHIRYWFQNDYFMKGMGTDVLDVPQWRSSGNGYSNFNTWSPTHGTIKGIYDAFYQLVSYANLTLSGAYAEHLNWDNEAERENIIAQAKFFRGLAYLTLGELYGGVPLVDQFITQPKYDFVRSSREETYRFAIQDLEEAAAGLPDYPQEAGKVAKGAAYHYLAEAYLALATDQNNNSALLEKSIEYAGKTMGLHRLMTERFGTRATEDAARPMNGINAYYPDGDVFFDLFQRGNLDYAEGNTEALWTLQNDFEVWQEFKGNNLLEYSRNFSPVFRDAYWKPEYREEGAHDSPWNSNIPAEYAGGNVSAYLGGRGISGVAPTNYVIDEIWKDKFAKDLRNSSANIRRELICLDQKHSMFGKVVTRDMLDESRVDRYYPIWTKFAPIDDWGYEDLEAGGNRSNMYRDEYACRVAETYLIRAEAYLRAGDKNKASEDINTLRRRARCEYMITPNEVSIGLILDERARELFIEERRWCTLMRMDGITAADQIQKHAYYWADYPVSGQSPIEWKLFPIPQSVIDANLNAVLEQNPGWK